MFVELGIEKDDRISICSEIVVHDLGFELERVVLVGIDGSERGHRLSHKREEAFFRHLTVVYRVQRHLVHGAPFALAVSAVQGEAG